jgi:hypothetical protein
VEVTFGKLTTIIAPHLVLIHFPPRRNNQTEKKKTKKEGKAKPKAQAQMLKEQNNK